MWDSHTRFVSVAHIVSESGDHELFTVDGWPDWNEIKRMAFEANPDWYGDLEYVYIVNVEQIRFTDE